MTTKKTYVIVRTYSAGVHCGILESRKGQEVTLSNTRRIWSWQGANTLHEVSLRGLDIGSSRVSDPVDSNLLLQAIEIIPCKPAAVTNLKAAKWQ